MVVTIRAEVNRDLAKRLAFVLKEEEAKAVVAGAAFTVGENINRVNALTVKIRFTRNANKPGERYVSSHLVQALKSMGATVSVSGRL